jgi:hypothetical protein
MTKHPSTLPDDIYALFDSNNDHEVSESNVEWAGEIFKDVLRTRLKKREEKSGEEVLRFSSLGRPDRQQWYDANDAEGAEQLPGKTLFKFLYGDLIEVLLLFLAREAGHEVTDEQLEVEEDGVRGHIDAKIDNVLVDVKSASSYSFQKFKSGEYVFDDPFAYVQQLAGYANKTGSEEAGWLVADKVHGDIAYVSLDPHYIKANPPGPRIEHLKKVIAQPSPPPRCYSLQKEGKSGNLKLPVGCSYCRHKFKCYADSNGGKGLRKFMYARGPTWLAVVKKEPKVDEA